MALMRERDKESDINEQNKQQPKKFGKTNFTVLQEAWLVTEYKTRQMSV